MVVDLREMFLVLSLLLKVVELVVLVSVVIFLVLLVPHVLHSSVVRDVLGQRYKGVCIRVGALVTRRSMFLRSRVVKLTSMLSFWVM